MRAHHASFRPIHIIVALALLACGIAGCTSAVRDLNAEIPIPLEMKQSTPEEAVRSYLEWLTYSYRNMDSEIATPTMTPDLAQRVAYYITMNAANGKALNQRLDSLEFVDVQIADTVATVKTRESWTFNYLVIETGVFDEPVVQQYEVTYTVLLIDGVWRVQAADATKIDTSDG